MHLIVDDIASNLHLGFRYSLWKDHLTRVL